MEFRDFNVVNSESTIRLFGIKKLKERLHYLRIIALFRANKYYLIETQFFHI
jgi:hypothetical protein